MDGDAGFSMDVPAVLAATAGGLEGVLQETQPDEGCSMEELRLR
eukprot:CAMPEP_0115555090 /NCGR_PEP_ID=MMETSP0271-20121206/97637_1 /TAXON_ID=71861 /ORGANISM="Scrippsiella trochoidea, Strain CCMP3099" /LENGTH=43 /DNA_ID= /DNA_START= /DNA_END= /DNA_ORIENTATION=